MLEQELDQKSEEVKWKNQEINDLVERSKKQ